MHEGAKLEHVTARWGLIPPHQSHCCLPRQRTNASLPQVLSCICISISHRSSAFHRIERRTTRRHNATMAPRHQHTFTLVPNPLGMQGLVARSAALDRDDAPHSKPPMTSKQAQKLYREATRGPRLSKAEQRRIEREEQERIRRELEKDRQANKARVLREKKKTKEREAAEEKRRRGLPLVTVRPSQGTIEGFVRGAGRKREAGAGAGAKERSETPEVVAAEKGDGGRESKRRRLSQRDGFDGTAVVDKGVERTTVPEKTGHEDTPRHEKTTGHDGMTRHEEVTRARHQEDTEHGNDKARPGAKSREEEHPRHKGRLRQEEAPSHEQNTGRKNKVEQEENENTRHEDKAEDKERAGHDLEVRHEKRRCEETPSKTPALQPRRQVTPVHGPWCEKTISTTPKAQADELAKPQLPNTTPGNKQKQTPKLPPTKTLTHPPLPHQRPSPQPQPAQHSTARKPLQETPNGLNRARTVSAAGSTSKFVSPHTPALTAPRLPTSSTVPTFRQPRPATPTARVQKPQFVPPHLRSAATHQRPSCPAAAITNQQKRKPADDFTAAPPTSTQLFVMTHLDELCPSPSQEARELRGDPPAAVVEPPRPRPSRPPLAGFAAKPATRPRPLARQVTDVNASMAPPPRPPAVKPATVKPATVKPPEPADIPFVSTQDLFLSSQDIRDVEEPTTTPSKTGGNWSSGRPPPFKHRSVVQRPSPLSGTQSRAPTQDTAPKFLARRTPVPSGQSTCARPNEPQQQRGGRGAAAPGQALNNQATTEQAVPTQTPVPPRPGAPREGRPPLDQKMNVAQQNAAQQNAATPQAAPPRHPSPEKPRYFTSSGSGVEFLLALDRSRKTHEDEERKRRFDAARRGLRNQSAEAERHSGVQDEVVQSKAAETAPGPAMGGQGQVLGPRSQVPESGTRVTSQDKAATDVLVTTHTASQETDYGDLELDSIDFEDLGLCLC